jgi:hypothetical protein
MVQRIVRSSFVHYSQVHQPQPLSLSSLRTLSRCWAPVVLVPAAIALSASGLKSGNSGERTGISVGTLGLSAVGSRVLATARARGRSWSRAVAGAGARSKAVPGTREGNAIATAAVGARWCVETGVALVDVPGDGDLLAVAVPDHMASSASRCLESGAVGLDCPSDEGGHERHPTMTAAITPMMAVVCMPWFSRESMFLECRAKCLEVMLMLEQGPAEVRLVELGPE